MEIKGADFLQIEFPDTVHYNKATTWMTAVLGCSRHKVWTSCSVNKNRSSMRTVTRIGAGRDWLKHLRNMATYKIIFTGQLSAAGGADCELFCSDGVSYYSTPCNKDFDPSLSINIATGRPSDTSSKNMDLFLRNFYRVLDRYFNAPVPENYKPEEEAVSEYVFHYIKNERWQYSGVIKAKSTEEAMKILEDGEAEGEKVIRLLEINVDMSTVKLTTKRKVL